MLSVRMFTLKHAQTQQLIDAEQARQARIAARLSYIEQEGKMPAYEVLLKQVDPLLVASIRDRIPDINEREYLYETLSAYLDQQGVQRSQPDMLLLHSRHEWHDEEGNLARTCFTYTFPIHWTKNLQNLVRTTGTREDAHKH